MKGKISKIRRAVGGVWDHNEFPVSIREYNCLQVSNEKKLERIEVTTTSASLSDDPVLMVKYKVTAVMRSLNEIEGVSA